jgi:hypothetical protein
MAIEFATSYACSYSFKFFSILKIWGLNMISGTYSSLFLNLWTKLIRELICFYCGNRFWNSGTVIEFKWFLISNKTKFRLENSNRSKF